MTDPSDRPRGYRLTVAGATDVGRARQNNEDAYTIAPIGSGPVAGGASGVAVFETHTAPLLLAVSDGMGGAAAGEVASALVLDTLRRSLPAGSDHWAESLQQGVERANQEVWKAGQRPETSGMGATLTALVLHGEEAFVAEVGDSRAYLLRHGALRLLTRDQTYVQALVDTGVLRPQDAERSPLKNIILSAMGRGPEVQIDIGRVRLSPGDCLLICSDGLTRELVDERIRQVLVEGIPPEETCARLIALANDNGGSDNITAIVATVEPAGPPAE